MRKRWKGEAMLKIKRVYEKADSGDGNRFRSTGCGRGASKRKI